MKLLKFEYTPLYVDLRYTYVLKPLLVLVIKTSKNGMELFIMFFLTGESNVFMFRILINFEFLEMIMRTK